MTRSSRSTPAAGSPGEREEPGYAGLFAVTTAWREGVCRRPRVSEHGPAPPVFGRLSEDGRPLGRGCCAGWASAPGAGAALAGGAELLDGGRATLASGERRRSR